MDAATKDAMQIQLNAERKRRGIVTLAEGEKQSAQLKADAELYTAQKQAEAKMVIADAEAYAVNAVAKAIASGGGSAIEFEIKKLQAQAIQQLGQSASTKFVMLPADVLGSLSSSAKDIFNKLA